MVGLDARATMDLDATIKGTNVSVEDVEMIISPIISIPLNDGVSFRIKRISEIMEEADYPGVRVSLETKLNQVRLWRPYGKHIKKIILMLLMFRGT